MSSEYYWQCRKLPVDGWVLRKVMYGQTLVEYRIDELVTHENGDELRKEREAWRILYAHNVVRDIAEYGTCSCEICHAAKLEIGDEELELARDAAKRLVEVMK